MAISPQARPVAVRRPPWGLQRRLDQFRFRSWFRGKEFTADWSSGNFSLWRRILSPLRNQAIRILEIGSWEGRSTIFFANYFPRSTVVCIDTFGGNANESKVYEGLAALLPGVEQRFDRNLAQFEGRIEKIRSLSAPALAMLQAQGRRFDLCYIDGSHYRDDVTADSLGVWAMLDVGGIVIWDDYRWGRGLPPEERPQPAIDDFLREHEGAYRLLAKNYQVIIERLA